MAWELGYSRIDIKKSLEVDGVTGTVFLNRKLEAGSSTVTSNQPPVGRPTHMSCPSTNPFAARSRRKWQYCPVYLVGLYTGYVTPRM